MLIMKLSLMSCYLREDIEISDLEEFLGQPVIEREPESEITDSDQPAPVISSKEAFNAMDIVRTFLEQSEENTAAILKQVEKITIYYE
ncbi:hypothetical protein R1flu_004370 [Riccia fluitans]|uniref:Uncharacterized protein n=1 Tax=Riccia fluitans TaxID=41844 RepID=A0ABD1YQ44_9MARC